MKGESYIQLCGPKVKVKGELAFINQEFSMVKGEGEIPMTFLPSPDINNIMTFGPIVIVLLP